MTEKDLIKNISLLKEIKPSKNWVISVKNEILRRDIKEEPKTNWVETLRGILRSPNLKPIFVTSGFVFVIFGTFIVLNNSPENLIYSFRNIFEKGKIAFVSEEQKPVVQLGFAEEKINGLSTSVKGANLYATLKSINQDLNTVSGQIKNVTPEQKQVLSSKTGQLMRKTQAALVEMQKNGIGEANVALFQIVSQEIKDLETRTLSEEQTQLLDQAKQDFAAENYGQALEKIWQISNK